MAEIDDRPQAAREKPEPQELARPVAKPLLALVFVLVVFGIVYILRSGPTESPALGDHRTLEDLTAKAVPAGKVDGAAVFAARCVACHQATGAGLPGVFPPLAGSEWVTGKAAIPIQIVLHGLQGTVTVKGATFNGQMPPLGDQMSDDEIAAAISYIRKQWGNTADDVDVAAVKEQRAATAARTAPWNGDAELATLK